MSEQPPQGYHLMLPPGWRGFPVDDEGLAEVQRLVGAKARAISRPDVEAQLRTVLRDQWQGLRSQLARQVFMQVDDTGRTLLPMSIAVRQLVAQGGADFAATLAGMTGTQPERFDLPIGPMYRAEREQRGGPIDGAISVSVLYGLPLPAPHDSKGLAFIGTIGFLEHVDAQLVRAQVELLDTIMETVRWR